MLSNTQKNQLLLAVIIMTVGLLATMIYFSNGKNESSPVSPSQSQPFQTQVGTPQPAGEVPPGKVWSTEHGHWHDASGVQVIDTDKANQPDSQ